MSCFVTCFWMSSSYASSIMSHQPLCQLSSTHFLVIEVFRYDFMEQWSINFQEIFMNIIMFHQVFQMRDGHLELLSSDTFRLPALNLRTHRLTDDTSITFIIICCNVMFSVFRKWITKCTLLFTGFSIFFAILNVHSNNKSYWRNTSLVLT